MIFERILLDRRAKRSSIESEKEWAKYGTLGYTTAKEVLKSTTLLMKFMDRLKLIHNKRYNIILTYFELFACLVTQYYFNLF